MAASFGVSLGFIIPPGKHTCLGWALNSGDLLVYNNPTPPSNSELKESYFQKTRQIIMTHR